MVVEYFKVKNPEEYLCLKRLASKDLLNSKNNMLKFMSDLVLGVEESLVSKVVKRFTVINMEDDDEHLYNIIASDLQLPKPLIKLILRGKELIK